jgi:hypothetical protein
VRNTEQNGASKLPKKRRHKMSAIKEAREWLESQTIEYYWDSRDKLGADDIGLILAGEAYAVGSQIRDWSLEYECEAEDALRQEATERFCVRVEDLDGVYPMVDVNLKGLVRNSRAYVTARLGIEHITTPYEPREYEDVAQELERLHVNPSDMNDNWPNIERADPLIAPEELKEAWLNCFYPGEWVALLDGAQVLELALEGRMEEIKGVKAGASITIYDYVNGAGSTLHTLQHDCPVESVYHDGADRYGVQACYGLVTQAWNGEVKE